jgi:hypothetical protein
MSIVDVAYMSSRGRAFKQAFQRFPALTPLYTAWESNYDVLPMKTWMTNHFEVPIAMVVVYLLG